jgi:hypothetical protein
MRTPKPDFEVSGEGPMTTVDILTPLNKGAESFLREHLSEDSQWFGRGVAVEHRFIGSLVQSLQREGFMVR